MADIICQMPIMVATMVTAKRRSALAATGAEVAGGARGDAKRR